MSKNLIIVDDHEVVRAGLRTFLHGDEFHIVGETASGAQAVELSTELRPDIALVDIQMSGMDGLECLVLMRRAAPETRVLMMCYYRNPTIAACAAALGAVGHLLKSADR